MWRTLPKYVSYIVKVALILSINRPCYPIAFKQTQPSNAILNYKAEQNLKKYFKVFDHTHPKCDLCINVGDKDDDNQPASEVEITCSTDPNVDDSEQVPPEGLGVIIPVSELSEPLKNLLLPQDRGLRERYYPRKVLILGLRWQNDNDPFNGAFFQLLGHEQDGSDHEFTHGLNLSASYLTENLTRFRLDLTSNLYTQRTTGEHGFSRFFLSGGHGSNLAIANRNSVDDRAIYYQNFMNESILKLWVDNIEKGKSVYYRAGVGLVHLDPVNSKGILKASQHQRWWHESVLDTYSFRNVPSKNERARISADIEATVGLQMQLLNKRSTCQLVVRGEAGYQFNNFDRSQLKLGSEQTLYFGKAPVTFKVGSRQNASVHNQGIGASLTTYTGLLVGTTNGGKVAFDVGYGLFTGTFPNSQQFHTRNPRTGKFDPIIELTMRYTFASKP